jgi:hypothetical protein
MSEMTVSLQNFTEMTVQILLFWAVTLCSLVSKYRRFGRTYCPNSKCVGARVQAGCKKAGHSDSKGGRKEGRKEERKEGRKEGRKDMNLRP